MLPVICVAAVAPVYMRPLIYLSCASHPVARKAITAVGSIAKATQTCVAERMHSDLQQGKGQPRRDMMQQFLDLKREQGEKVDFGTGEVESEICTAL